MEAVKRVTPAMAAASVRSRRNCRIPILRLKTRWILDERRQQRVDLASSLVLEAGERLEARASEVVSGNEPQMAREIVMRALGRPDVLVRDLPFDAATVIAREARRLLDPSSPRHGRRASTENPRQIAAFAAVPFGSLRLRFEEVSVDSISEAAARFEGSDQEAHRSATLSGSNASSSRSKPQECEPKPSVVRSQSSSRKSTAADQYRLWGESMPPMRICGASNPGKPSSSRTNSAFHSIPRCPPRRTRSSISSGIAARMTPEPTCRNSSTTSTPSFGI